MLRLRLLTSLAVAVAVLPAASADAAKGKRTACERLAGRDLAPAAKLKVVKRERDGSSKVLACALRYGKVRTLAEFIPVGEFESGGIDVLDTTDRYVLLAESSFERGSGFSVTRVDARTRRRTLIAYESCDPDRHCTGSTVGESFLHRSGVLLAIIGDAGACCAPEQLVRVGPDGSRRVLDEAGDLSALAFAGGAVTWRHDGEERRAAISGAPSS